MLPWAKLTSCRALPSPLLPSTSLAAKPRRPISRPLSTTPTLRPRQSRRLMPSGTTREYTLTIGPALSRPSGFDVGKASPHNGPSSPTVCPSCPFQIRWHVWRRDLPRDDAQARRQERVRLPRSASLRPTCAQPRLPPNEADLFARRLFVQGAILPVFDAIYNSKHFDFVLPRHEQGAGHMAEGYARVSGKPGVCLVTSGFVRSPPSRALSPGGLGADFPPV